MKEQKLNSIPEVMEGLGGFTSSHVFRGQARSEWGICSTLERLLHRRWRKDDIAKFEDYTLQEFKSRFHLYDRENMQPRSRLQWLSIMQHYGAPTRLIDFTSSPFVALYFALEAITPEEIHAPGDIHFSIYSLDCTAIMRASIAAIKQKDPSFSEDEFSLCGNADTIFSNLLDEEKHDVVLITEPSVINKRIDRQAGCFGVTTIPANRFHEKLRDEIYKDVEQLKFNIPYSLIPQLWALLRSMNINSKTIYGDLQGLGNFLRAAVKIYAS